MYVLDGEQFHGMIIGMSYQMLSQKRYVQPSKMKLALEIVD